MEKVVSRELCDERYRNVTGDVKVLFEKHDDLSKCISKKFNQIMFGIFLTLLSVISSLAVMLLKSPPPPH